MIEQIDVDELLWRVMQFYAAAVDRQLARLKAVFVSYDTDHSRSLDHAEANDAFRAMRWYREAGSDALGWTPPEASLDTLWREMNEFEGDDEDDDEGASNVVAISEAFALVCHQHAVYPPHEMKLSWGSGRVSPGSPGKDGGERSSTGPASPASPGGGNGEGEVWSGLWKRNPFGFSLDADTKQQTKALLDAAEGNGGQPLFQTKLRLSPQPVRAKLSKK